MRTEELEELRRDLCYHEAAHAVFDHSAGLTIRHVYVNEEDDAWCEVEHYEPYWWQAIELASGIIGAEYAVYRRRGSEIPRTPFAEFAEEVRMIELDAEGEPEPTQGQESDTMRVMELLRIAAGASEDDGGSVEECYVDACERAAYCLEDYWERIEAVAEKLFKVGYLSGDDCHAMIEHLE